MQNSLMRKRKENLFEVAQFSNEKRIEKWYEIAQFYNLNYRIMIIDFIFFIIPIKTGLHQNIDYESEIKTNPTFSSFFQKMPKLV